MKKNLIKIIEISIGKGRPKKYPVLLPDSYKLLGIEEKKFFGKGAGHEHILYQHLIAEHFKKYNPKNELYRGGKHIDIGIETNDKLIAVEVEMTPDHAIENITKDIEKAKANFVIVACKDSKIFKEVQINIIALQNDFRNRTEIILISKLLNINAGEAIDLMNRNIFK